MNRFLSPVLFLAFFSIASAEPPSVAQKHEVHTHRNTSWSDLTFVIDRTEIRDTDALKVFVTKLPTGATLHWDSGCFMYKTLPLHGPTVKLSEFRAFCTERGVKFVFVCGY